MKVLLTGAAGFIGCRVSMFLVRDGMEVLGVDSLCDYYDPALKRARLRNAGIEPEADNAALDLEEGRVYHSSRFAGFSFAMTDVRSSRFAELAADFAPDVVIHLAAQPGVRHSTAHPEDCLEMNVMAFMRVLEVCRELKVGRMLYASSSSVYGDYPAQSFRESDQLQTPRSIYAVSKRTNEMLADVYARMYGIKMVGMRFFSVYGPWGRPDMAPIIFTRAIMAGEPISLFNAGHLSRDFTYIDDVAHAVSRIVAIGQLVNPESVHEVINIGHGVPTLVADFVSELEHHLGRKANIRLLPMQPGEMRSTLADNSRLRMQYGYSPPTTLRRGLARLVAWAREYYGVSPD